MFPVDPNSLYVRPEALRTFMEDVFRSLGVPEEDAAIGADVLLEADLRGVDSHGSGRLWIYVDRLKKKQQSPVTTVTTVTEGPGTALLDGGSGLGHVVAVRAMEVALHKAGETGIAGVAVRNSSHFGFAGYYPLMAVEQGMVGMAFTNARPSICPTFGCEPMLGTNPIAFGAPTDLAFPFLFDAATSIIQRGAVELYDRLGMDLPGGLVIDPEGKSLSDPAAILKKMMEGNAALLPLGGAGEAMGGYKGYGLAAMVEILSAAFQNGPYLKQVTGVGLGHFFIVIDVSRFLPLPVFKALAGNILRDLRGSRKLPGEPRIYVAGEKEYDIRNERLDHGIPLSGETLAQLDAMAKDLHVERLVRSEKECCR